MVWSCCRIEASSTDFDPKTIFQQYEWPSGCKLPLWLLWCLKQSLCCCNIIGHSDALKDACSVCYFKDSSGTHTKPDDPKTSVAISTFIGQTHITTTNAFTPQLNLNSPRRYTDSQVVYTESEDRENNGSHLFKTGWMKVPSWVKRAPGDTVLGRKTLWINLPRDSYHLSYLLEHCGDAHCGWKNVMMCQSLTQLICLKIAL